MTAKSTNQRFFGIQYLRAIAALMVVCFHFLITFDPTAGGPRLYGFLNRGVDLFFVISGFIMVVTGSHLSPLEFVRRRILRIVPLYWLLTCILAGRAVLAPNLFKNLALSWTFFLKSLLFIPFANPASEGLLKPLLVPGWTLNYEMFFYAVFALMLSVARQRLVVYTGILFAVMSIAHGFLPSGSLGSFYCNPLILEFWFGMVIGYCYPAVRMSTLVKGILALSGGVLLFLSPDVYLAIVATALIIFGVCLLEPAIPKIPALALLGDASYSIYLLHLFVFSITRVIWHGGGLGFALFTLAAVLGTSILCYRWFERPVARLGSRASFVRPPAEAMTRRGVGDALAAGPGERAG